MGLGTGFLRLWAASTTSALGSGIATVAAPLLVASQTSDPLAVAAASAAAWLPWLLFALPGGVLVDRVDRRRLMILIDWVRVATTAVLAATLLLGRTNVVLLYVALFLVNTGEVMFRPASQAMIQSVVPRAGLERANGWLIGGTMLMQQMVAGPLGAALFVLSASLPFFVNAGTYAASALLIALVAGTYRATAEVIEDAPPARRSMRAELAEGLRWLMAQRLLRTMAFLIGLLNLTLVAATSVLVLVAQQRLHLGPAGFGLLITSVAAGGVLGSLVGHRLIGWVSATWTIRVGLLIEAGTHAALALLRSPALIGVVLFAFGLHGALWSIVGGSLRQRLTPPALVGRVSSTTLFIGAGGNCLGAVLGGTLATAFGLTAPYWVGFVSPPRSPRPPGGCSTAPRSPRRTANRRRSRRPDPLPAELLAGDLAVLGDRERDEDRDDGQRAQHRVQHGMIHRPAVWLR